MNILEKIDKCLDEAKNSQKMPKPLVLTSQTITKIKEKSPKNM